MTSTLDVEPLRMRNMCMSLQDTQVAADEVHADAARFQAEHDEGASSDHRFRVRPLDGVLVATKRLLVVAGAEFSPKKTETKADWTRTTDTEEVSYDEPFRAAKLAVGMWDEDGPQFSMTFWGHPEHRYDQGAVPGQAWELIVGAGRKGLVEIQEMDSLGHIIGVPGLLGTLGA